MLRLTTFGHLSVTRGEETLGPAATQRRRLALLAILAVAGDRGLPRDKILALLWPESGEERARHSLTQSLYALRRDLREDALFLGTADVRLNPEALTSDVADFVDAIARRERERAVALHAGPFLDGCFLSDAPEFERWVEGERARFRQQVASALEALAATATAAGEYLAAADWWGRLAALDPLNGRVAVGLMTALAAAGNTSGALQHARIHETLVRNELDAAPDAAVLRLAEQLRTVKEPGARTPADSPSTATPIEAPRAASLPRASAPLATAALRRGRSAPMRLLTTTTWHAVETANAARRSLVLRRLLFALVTGAVLVLFLWVVWRYVAAR
jgi:serine/threonine-protein kinase